MSEEAIVAAIERALVPVLEPLGVELYDVERGAGLVRILVDRPGGIDLETLGAVTREVRTVVDGLPQLAHANDALEVSSPGVERPLRRPRHFEAAIGSPVTVKTRDDAGAARRLRGTVEAADADGFDLVGEDGAMRVRYEDVVAARTVFEWGPSPKPGSKPRSSTSGDKRQQGRKEVAAR
jgi:ribosome maturation factor RimP